MNPFAPIAPSSLMLSAERIMINFSWCLLCPTRHTPCVQFHCRSGGDQYEKGLLKMLSDFIQVSLELATCTVLTCWIVCSVDSCGKLLILKVWRPLLEPEDSSLGGAYQLHSYPPLTGMQGLRCWLQTAGYISLLFLNRESF